MADLFIIGINTGENNATVLNYYQNLGLQFSALSGTEGGGTAINNTYQIGAYPTYILIAPNHEIVEQDIWPVPSTQTFITAFENNGVQQAECSTVNADFISDQTEVCEMDQVAFTDLSSGDITSWAWTFEGGDPATSSEQNPVVTYNEEGAYDVELTVSDGTNSSTLLLEDYIDVLMTPPTMLLPFEDVCVGWPAFELTGGSPAGGVYSGPGVVDGWFDPGVAGIGTHTITYTYSAANGCDNFDEETILVDPCTGIDKLAAGQMSIFPNPTTGVFKLKLNQHGDVNIKVFNMLGVTVYEENVTISGEFNQTINLQGFENGIYFVAIQSGDDTAVKKLRLAN
jgi:PKD repeat protein